MIRLLVFEETKKSERRGPGPKRNPRPKIKILKSGSVFRSLRGTNCIPNFMMLRAQTSKITCHRQTDKQTDVEMTIIIVLLVMSISVIHVHCSKVDATYKLLMTTHYDGCCPIIRDTSNHLSRLKLKMSNYIILVHPGYLGIYNSTSMFLRTHYFRQFRDRNTSPFLKYFPTKFRD